MTGKNFAEAIDQLGRLRDRLHVLNFNERALTKLVGDGLRAVKGRSKRAAGKRYEAELTQSHRLVVQDLKGLKRAAGRKFLACVKADIKAARAQLGEDVLRKLGCLEKSEKVCVYKREPGKAPRRAPKG